MAFFVYKIPLSHSLPSLLLGIQIYMLKLFNMSSVSFLYFPPNEVSLLQSECFSLTYLTGHLSSLQLYPSCYYTYLMRSSFFYFILLE